MPSSARKQGLFGLCRHRRYREREAHLPPPHVFSDADLGDEKAVKANWEAERPKSGPRSTRRAMLDDIPSPAC